MADLLLILYGRKGCCLCEALEQKLRSINLNELSPSLKLSLFDIDSSEISEAQRIKYDLEVPVLFIQSKTTENLIEIPRISPRLNEEGIKNLLQKIINKQINCIQN